MAAADAAAGLLCFSGRPTFLTTALILFGAKNVYCACRGGAWVRQRLLDQGYRAFR